MALLVIRFWFLLESQSSIDLLGRFPFPWPEKMCILLSIKLYRDLILLLFAASIVVVLSDLLYFALLLHYKMPSVSAKYRQILFLRSFWLICFSLENEQCLSCNVELCWSALIISLLYFYKKLCLIFLKIFSKKLYSCFTLAYWIFCTKVRFISCIVSIFPSKKF